MHVKVWGRRQKNLSTYPGVSRGISLCWKFETAFTETAPSKNGTGLSNVKKVAEKYGGAMNIETQEKVFILHVLLIIPGDQGEMP